MKKLATLLFALSLAFMASAQDVLTINNLDFEKKIGNFPENWATSLNVNIQEVPLLGTYPLTMSFGKLTSDSHSGSNALELKPASINIPSIGGSAPINMTIPGICQLGKNGPVHIPMSEIDSLMNMDFTDPSSIQQLEMLAPLMSPGVPATFLPTYMKVWAKFLPEAGVTDSLLVQVVASKWIGGYRTPVAQNTFIQTEPLTEYTQLDIEIETLLGELPDTLSLYFVIGGTSPSNGVVAYIDDIEIEGYNEPIIGIATENEPLKYTLYPNPASDIIIIEPALSDIFSVRLMDVSGKRVLEKNGLSGKSNIDVSALRTGTYFVEISQGAKTVFRKVVIE